MGQTGKGEGMNEKLKLSYEGAELEYDEKTKNIFITIRVYPECGEGFAEIPFDVLNKFFNTLESDIENSTRACSTCVHEEGCTIKDSNIEDECQMHKQEGNS